MWRLLSVRNVIYFYIFVCVALLVFNLLYISRSDSVKRRQRQKQKHWEKYLDSFVEGQAPIWDRDKLFRRLQNVQELMAFQEVMEDRHRTRPEDVEFFFENNREMFWGLAAKYGKKTAMERAFFAYVIASFYPPVGEKREPLLEQLLGYMEDSTVYSRENVLNALYALGNIQTVEHAFALMSQREWYHDSRLLADGLARFRGDRASLARRLWERCNDWLECFQVGVVRFANTLPGDDFAESFLEALEEGALPLETKFALVRYFHRHAVPAARSMLLRLLKGQTGEDQELAIAAAISLSAYPDDETRQALKTALHSRNWYVRQNAARSLKTLGFTREEVAQVEATGDRYAVEMLEYVLGYQTSAAAEEKSESEGAKLYE